MAAAGENARLRLAAAGYDGDFLARPGAARTTRSVSVLRRFVTVAAVLGLCGAGGGLAAVARPVSCSRSHGPIPARRDYAGFVRQTALWRSPASPVSLSFILT